MVYLFDVNTTSIEELQSEIQHIHQHINASTHQHILFVGNKIDGQDEVIIKNKFSAVEEIIYLSAKNKSHISLLAAAFSKLSFAGKLKEQDVIVTNARHAEALQQTAEALQRAYEGMNAGISGELLAQDIRMALHYLGIITGEVTTDNCWKIFLVGFVSGNKVAKKR